jgi:hypothetical protein
MAAADSTPKVRDIIPRDVAIQLVRERLMTRRVIGPDDCWLSTLKSQNRGYT